MNATFPLKLTAWVPPRGRQAVVNSLANLQAGYTRTSVMGGWFNPETAQYIEEEMDCWSIFCDEAAVLPLSSLFHMLGTVLGESCVLLCKERVHAVIVPCQSQGGASQPAQAVASHEGDPREGGGPRLVQSGELDSEGSSVGSEGGGGTGSPIAEDAVAP